MYEGKVSYICLLHRLPPPSPPIPQPSAPDAQSMGERFLKGCLGEQIFSANYLLRDVLRGD